MFRTYEDARELERRLAKAKAEYEQHKDDFELAMDVQELEERTNFAWQDEYQED